MEPGKAQPEIRKQHIIITQPGKSIVLAILFSAFLGPLGVAYTSVPGAIILGVLTVIAWVFDSATGHFVVWVVGVVWNISVATWLNRGRLM